MPPAPAGVGQASRSIDAPGRAAVKFATWNVNSVRIREPHVCRYLQRAEPDVLLLQEIKCEAPAFPTAGFAELDR